MNHQTLQHSTQSGRKVLSGQQSFALGTYLQRNKDRLLRDRPAKEQVATEAGVALGFEVTTENVKTACKNTGVRWTALRQETGARGDRQRIIHLMLVDKLRELGAVFSPVELKLLQSNMSVADYEAAVSL